MSSSLQEQLLKAGLVSEDQVRKSRQDTRRGEKGKPKSAKKNRPAASAPRQDPRIEALRREQEAKRERDKKINQQREAQKAVKEAKQRARQFARKACLNTPEAEVAFHFVRGGAVKRLYVTEEQRVKLVGGALAIVAPAETHFIVSRSDADEVLRIFADSFMFSADKHNDIGTTGSEEESSTAADDPYADYKVPDDLTW